MKASSTDREAKHTASGLSSTLSNKRSPHQQQHQVDTWLIKSVNLSTHQAVGVGGR
jgi:hypothetical protein